MRLDIELTENCSLRCPGCYLKGRSKNEISIDILNKIIDKYSPDKVILRGKCGDPIYHTKILEVISIFKSHDISIIMDTNGQLPVILKIDKLLDSDDMINFAIDGFCRETYEKYRINGDIDIAKQHLLAMKNCRAIYKTIRFEYITNKEIQEIMLFCKNNKLGCLFEHPWRNLHAGLKSVNKFKCRSGTDELPITFDVNGIAYACCNMLPNKYSNNDYTPNYTVKNDPEVVKENIACFDKTNNYSCKETCGVYNQAQAAIIDTFYREEDIKFND